MRNLLQLLVLFVSMALPFPNPNPKMVTPHDLEMTPSHYALGRVKPAASPILG
ncbi:hypothetical protein [Lysobacter sp.]|uniref:hypothetical protein n=1 Tax=Lysobacter sp. TaxID=72226 RepID=UPI002D3A8AF8|nr:hypothetical protein [Lysobacter sp.]HZX79285.1 hypothetical protein [Lysobacter sp.]